MLKKGIVVRESFGARQEDTAAAARKISAGDDASSASEHAKRHAGRTRRRRLARRWQAVSGAEDGADGVAEQAPVLGERRRPSKLGEGEQNILGAHIYSGRLETNSGSATFTRVE